MTDDHNPLNHFRETTMFAQILFKKHLANAKVPSKGTSEAAAFDLTAAHIEYRPGQRMLVVDTGLSTAFPAGYALHLYGRSGHAMKHGIRLANSVAVIDADYRGPLKVLLVTNDPADYETLTREINIGDRVAQAILIKLPDVEWAEVDELPDSVRGEGGFGSTGTK